MRKIVLLTLFLLAIVGWTFAQAGSSSSSTDQTGTSATPQQQTTPDQTGATSNTGTNPDATQTGTTPDQGAAAGATDQNANQDTGKKLPQTASPLPLIGLIGLGSLAAGVATRKRK